MGRPFKVEINRIANTITWANSLGIKEIQSAFENSRSGGWIIVGSGGSLSACHFIVSLLTQQGVLARAVTPLELLHSQEIINKNNILVISASGRNRDILFAFKVALQKEPKKLVAVSMYPNSPLANLCKKYDICTAIEFDIPSGKDGFLATNSLIAYYVIFSRVFINRVLRYEERQQQNFDDFLGSLTKQSTLTVLYSGWGKSIGIDFESKCTESALFPVLLADYRNFGHGRHHWFAKQPDSAIIAIVSQEDEALAKKTLAELPSGVPRLVLQSKMKGPEASLSLLVLSFLLIDKLGDMQGIDPGRPGVPSFGRKLYNLNYVTTLTEKKSSSISVRGRAAINRKLRAGGCFNPTPQEFSEWSQSYEKFVKNLNRQKFGAIVFDYDGTICSQNRRFEGIDEEISDELNRILTAGISVAIVTGRGKSVRLDLQKKIDQRFWPKVLLGYYNGGIFANLGENSIPDTSKAVPGSLKLASNLLGNIGKQYGIRLTERPWQLTVEVEQGNHWKSAKMSILQSMKIARFTDLQIVESSHSLDIIPIATSKLNIVGEIKPHLNAVGLHDGLLFIGDRGQWPGNDYELLSTPNSLSVDEVSIDQESCWNLAEIGLRGVGATAWYLQKLSFHQNHFKIKMPL